MNSNNESFRVWVTQGVPGYDYVPAEDFGNVSFITHRDFSSQQDSPVNRELIDDILTAVSKINPDEDYVVVSGSPAVTAVVFMALGRKSGKLRLLRYDSRQRAYTPTMLEVK